MVGASHPPDGGSSAGLDGPKELGVSLLKDVGAHQSDAASARRT